MLCAKLICNGEKRFLVLDDKECNTVLGAVETIQAFFNKYEIKPKIYLTLAEIIRHFSECEVTYYLEPFDVPDILAQKNLNEKEKFTLCMEANTCDPQTLKECIKAKKCLKKC